MFFVSCKAFYYFYYFKYYVTLNFFCYVIIFFIPVCVVDAALSKKIIMTKAPRSSSNSGQEKASTVAPEMSPHKVKRKSGAVSESDKDILKSKKPKVEHVDELAPPVTKRRAPSGKGKGNVGGSGKEAASASKETVKKEKDAVKQEPDVTSQGSLPPQRAQRKSNIYR